MKTYSYRARNMTGRVVDGIIQAEDSGKAQQQLEKDGLIPIEISSTSAKAFGHESYLFSPAIKDQDLIMFTRQLSTMLDAGMPILQVFQVLKTQAVNPRLGKALEEIGNSINRGSRLSEAMAEFPSIFPREYTNMVISGESGADLVQALSRLADWMERESEIRSDIKSAVRYPIVVIVALVIASCLMIGFVIPRFAMFYANSNVPLPLPTRMLLASGNFTQNYWPLIIGLIVAFGSAVYFLLRIPRVRLKFDRIKFRLPVAGPLYGKIVISRFLRIFSMMIRNGVPVLKALEICPTVVANTFVKQSTERARESIQGGSSILEGFESVGLFPPMITSLIAIGEKTGSLDQMLDFVVAQYELEVKYALKNLPATIEPIVTVIMGIGVLFFALAVYLPIWNMAKVIAH